MNKLVVVVHVSERDVSYASITAKKRAGKLFYTQITGLLNEKEGLTAEEI